MSAALQLSDAPAGWREEAPFAGSRVFRSNNGLLALRSVDEIDGKRWLHISVSRRSRMPTYDDLFWAKDSFIGPLVAAYQCFPVRTDHVNLHEFCLHLWCCLDGDPFPDHVRRNGAQP